jgi:hypothetical protein
MSSIYLTTKFLLLCITCLFLNNQVLAESPEIYDPYDFFCGSKSCYDIIGVERNASLKEIKKVSI